MLKQIKDHLLKIVNDIDLGNSNLTEEEGINLLNTIQVFTDKKKRLSKYASCKYLRISRATFDNYIRRGLLPKGKHEVGFKELSWTQQELDIFIKNNKGAF